VSEEPEGPPAERGWTVPAETAPGGSPWQAPDAWAAPAPWEPGGGQQPTPSPSTTPYRPPQQTPQPSGPPYPAAPYPGPPQSGLPHSGPPHSGAPYPGPQYPGPPQSAPPYPGVPYRPPVPPAPAAAPSSSSAPPRIEPVAGTDFGLAYFSVAPTVSGQAIGSLVAGILSIVVALIVACFGLTGAQAGWGPLVGGAFAVLAIAAGLGALGLGWFSVRQITRFGGRLTGRGMAVAGISCGAVGLALTVVAMLLSLVI
jgi:hypothetical protein